MESRVSKIKLWITLKINIQIFIKCPCTPLVQLYRISFHDSFSLCHHTDACTFQLCQLLIIFIKKQAPHLKLIFKNRQCRFGISLYFVSVIETTFKCLKILLKVLQFIKKEKRKKETNYKPVRTAYGSEVSLLNTLMSFARRFSASMTVILRTPLKVDSQLYLTCFNYCASLLLSFECRFLQLRKTSGIMKPTPVYERGYAKII